MRPLFARARQLLQATGLAGALVFAHASGAEPREHTSEHARLAYARAYPRARPDTTPEALARKAIDVHFKLWYKAWEASEGHRHSLFGRDGKRSMFVHCHIDGRSENPANGELIPSGQIIRSRYTAFAACPSWPHYDEPKFEDESAFRDAAIDSSRRATINKSRGELITTLGMLLRRAPASQLITGQLVRFLLEQQMQDSALYIAKQCHAERWLCDGLVGFVYFTSNNLVAAESAFAQMRTAMAQKDLCKWNDIRVLLPTELRIKYARSTCGRQAETNERYWWLADPMFVDPGNERHVVHDARKMLDVIYGQLPTEARFEWATKAGGDAMSELVVRYGWPSYTFWAGSQEDDSHSSYLRSYNTDPRPPYTTFEYTRGRVHTAADLSAILKPFSATEQAWTINPPETSDSLGWWPIEHFARSRALLQINESQTAMLRRQNDIVFATAYTTATQRLRTLGDRFTANLILSPSATQFDTANVEQVRHGQTFVMRSRIVDTASTLVSVEIRGTQPDEPDARTRFAVTPPRALNAMKPRDVALSDPVLLNADKSAVDYMAMGDSVVTAMLGTMRLARTTRKVAVYWESYGFRADDSVRVAVRVERHEDVSTLRRIGIALRVADDPNSTTSFSWREPDRSHVVRNIDGDVPVQARALTLDLSNLPIGEYDIVVSVGKTDATAVSSRRRITLVDELARAR